jgi:hypothetical protein
LTDAYEVETQIFFEKETSNIKMLTEKLRQAADAEKPDSILSAMVNQLISVVKNWDTIAQPIQVSTKSRGLDHSDSLMVAGLVRGLAIHIYNKNSKLELSRQLTDMLQEVFAEVVEIADRTAEDANLLDGIAKKQSRLIADAKKQAEEWRKEITYEADVGAVFKDKLRISPDGIEWKGRRWELDAITRIHWGRSIYYINSVNTVTTYSVFWGIKYKDQHSHATIEVVKQDIYNNFVNRLWRAVGVRLLTEYLEGLRAGKEFRFGNIAVTDFGIELERKKLFSTNERVFCPWDDLTIWNEAGSFYVGKKAEKDLTTAFSYQKEDNIHVLEAAIQMYREHGGERLSDLLVQQ